MERTTNLEDVKSGAPFTWGEVVKVHEVGPYAIVEYLEWRSEGVRVYSGEVGGRLSFFCYVDGKSLSMSFATLDHALAHCIAARHQEGGFNSNAALYFMRMIGAA